MNRKIPILMTYTCLFVLDFLYHYSIRSVSIIDSAGIAIIEATLYTFVLWVTTRLDLARVTLCFLALPYLFFIPGWLNTPTAVVVGLFFIYCMQKTLKSTRLNATFSQSEITPHELLGFLMILVWVNMSGAGGYGYQNRDYAMHNARLRDLIEYSWPVRYSENMNFVYYFGYFIPSAIIGKLTSLDIGLRSMFLWTALGATLVIRWLSYLSGWRFSFMLVFAFMMFGPMDGLNALSAAISSNSPLINALQPAGISELEFVSGGQLEFFIGNYLSNTFQLYWSPQQVIPGWLGIALLTHLFLNKKFNQIFFIYALLCLWAPLVMIAIFPFILLIFLTATSENWRTVITFDNSIGAGALVLIFMVFYLSGSGNANPSVWITDATNWNTRKIVILVFFVLFSWGLYAIAVMPYIVKQAKLVQWWFYCLVFSLAVLPLKIFGEYSDLLCRGSSSLMFLLLVFLLKALNHYWTKKQKIGVITIALMFVVGMQSALIQNALSIFFYGRTQPVTHVFERGKSYPNFGPDNTIFERYLRRDLPNN